MLCALSLTSCGMMTGSKSPDVEAPVPPGPDPYAQVKFYCGIVQPIWWKDSWPDDAIAQAKLHNATVKQHCPTTQFTPPGGN